MKFLVDNTVCTRFPDLFLSFGLIENCTGFVFGDDDLRAQAVVDAVNNAYESADQILNSDIASFYANFYRNLGLKASTVSTPCKQAARVKRTQKYKPILPIVDLCMSIEYTTLISFQVYDADKIVGDLIYRFAKGGEPLCDFHGEMRLCKEGDLLLTDGEGVVHSCAHGNNKNKLVQPDSKRALVRIMRVPQMVMDRVRDAQKLVNEKNAVNWVLATPI